MKIKIKHWKRKKFFAGICILFILYIAYQIITFTPSSSVSTASLDVPEWLENDIDISKNYNIEDYSVENCGPTVETTNQSYEVMRLRVYDADTGEFITDEETMEKILLLFQYTEDSFVYIEDYSGQGTICFCYDGKIEANQPVSIFSGFQGTDEILYNKGKKIEKISIQICSSSMQAKYDWTIDEIMERVQFYG